MELSQIDPHVIVDDCKGLILGDELKIGGQKRVWKCAYGKKAYVLKALMADPSTHQRVKREIKIMRTCDSPYLPKFGPIPLKELKLKDAVKVLYFLEEYIDGMSLDSVSKPMDYKEVVRLATCITEALSELAKNQYVHRDVKPMNIIQKTPFNYILLDAGLAFHADGDALTSPGKIAGTRLYLSPDQIKLEPKRLDIRSDLFSLGITLYECVTGKHPFWNNETPIEVVLYNIMHLKPMSPDSFNPTVPKLLSFVILKLLRKNRNTRYPKVNQLHRDLSKVT